jgi:CheY-like chemotaxis protein
MGSKILVAEDDPTTQGVLRAILLHAGYEVILAEDGQIAVEMARSEKPDLVLTDGLLPRLHGFLVCKAIRELPAPPPVILLTGVYMKPAYRWEAKQQYGAEELLTKPITPRALLDCIARYLPTLSPTDVMKMEIERLMEYA